MRTGTSAGRLRGDTGATLAEYALVFAALVTATIGGAKYLEARGKTEVANQAECISKRPPPVSCVQPTITTTTTITPPPPTPSTTSPPVPEGSASAITTTGSTKTPINIVARTTLTDPGGAPISGATVTFRIRPSNGTSFPVTCTSNGSGQCTITVNSLQNGWPAGVTVTIEIINIDSDPPITTYPSAAVLS